MDRKFYGRSEVMDLITSKRVGNRPSLAHTDLHGDLSSLDLSGISLSMADLSSCDLRYTDLSRTRLNYALSLEWVVGVVAFMGIGSRNDTLYVWRQNNIDGRQDYIFVTGCFEGTEAYFRKAISEKVHLLGEEYKPYATSYRQAIPLLKRALDLQYQS